MNTKNETNKHVDWWFMYKLPEHAGSENNEGLQYLYFDSQSDKLELSANTLDMQKGALFYTLESILNSNNKNQGYIVYNDEHPEGKGNSRYKGHCKGILAFNKEEDSATMLLHSVPRFPVKGRYELPENERRYGQTFLCITLSNYEIANKIAGQMLQQQNPQVLVNESYLPTDITESEAIYQFFHQSQIKESETPSTIQFKSKAGTEFKMIAKSRIWGKDFWIDLVGVELNTNLEVESWRNGIGGPDTPTSKPMDPEEIDDVLQINLAPLGYEKYYWHYTKDHAKWAVADKSNHDENAWVCVGDINRRVSQEKRGGGSICFREPKLWKALRSIVSSLKV